MKKAVFFLCASLLPAIYSCVSEFNARVPENEYALLVVEGDIIGDSLLQFSFSKSFSLNDYYIPQEYDQVEIAELAVIGSNGYRSAVATAAGKGIYRLGMGALDEDVAYGIEFEYEGNIYRSELMKPLRTPVIDKISCLQPVEKGEVSICVSTHDDHAETGYYMWRYIEDWEITSPYEVTVIYNPETDKFEDMEHPYPYYYCWRQNYCKEILIGSTEKLTRNIIENHPLIKKGADDDRFSELYSVSIEQQAISKAGYEYYLDLQKGNSDMGGIFTPQPSKIEGNITCITDRKKKAIGQIEVAHNVTTARLFVPTEKITKPISNISCDILEEADINNLLNEGYTYLDLYLANYRPVTWRWNWPLRTIRLPYTMTDIKCTDCREVGGSKTRPSFWPNDHE